MFGILFLKHIGGLCGREFRGRREMVGAPQRDRRVGGVVAGYGGLHALRASFAEQSRRVVMAFVSVSTLVDL
jgi:hypothetical protein